MIFTSTQILRDKIGNFLLSFYDSNAQTFYGSGLIFLWKKARGNQMYLKTPLSGPLETRCFCLFRAKTKFPRQGWYSPGALETCFFRAISFIHRKASQNGRRGEFLGIS